MTMDPNMIGTEGSFEIRVDGVGGEQDLVESGNLAENIVNGIVNNVVDSVVETTPRMEIMEVEEGSMNDVWTFALSMGGSFLGAGGFLGLIYLLV